MLLRHDLLGYLVWEIWDMKTKYAVSQRQRGRLKAENRRLRARAERFVLYRVEAALRRVLRPLVLRLRQWRVAGQGRATPPELGGSAAGGAGASTATRTDRV
jgi:hypothetical protein